MTYSLMLQSSWDVMLYIYDESSGFINVVSSDSKDRSNRGRLAGGESDSPSIFIGVEVKGCTALMESVLIPVVDVETLAWQPAQFDSTKNINFNILTV